MFMTGVLCTVCGAQVYLVIIEDLISSDNENSKLITVHSQNQNFFNITYTSYLFSIVFF